jgi:hypothetical protein
VAQGVKPGVFGLGALGRDQPAIDDLAKDSTLPTPFWEHEITLALGTRELSFLQGVGDELAEGHHALTRRRLGLALRIGTELQKRPGLRSQIKFQLESQAEPIGWLLSSWFVIATGLCSCAPTMSKSLMPQKSRC